jgi:inward rectifier potassium channel
VSGLPPEGPPKADPAPATAPGRAPASGLRHDSRGEVHRKPPSRHAKKRQVRHATLLPAPPVGGVRPARLVPRESDEAPLRLGFPAGWHSDFYHHTLTLPWWAYLVLGMALYLGLNIVFAELYLLAPGGIDKARPGDFEDAFFFSIQTMATIGYGVLTPVGTYTNLLVTLETMVSLVFIAFVTGITFARFSRPTARVDFSRVCTVSTYNGTPTLAVRLANGRRNQILEADVTLTLVRNERTLEGILMRRFYDLPLARARTPIFSLTFTVMHPINDASPLFGCTSETLMAEQAELLVTVTGIDETMSQTIHARTSYQPDEILFGHRFVDMFGYTVAGRLAIDYTRFNDSIPEEFGGPGSLSGQTLGDGGLSAEAFCGESLDSEGLVSHQRD